MPYKSENVKEISSSWLLDSYNSMYSNLERKTYIIEDIDCKASIKCAINILNSADRGAIANDMFELSQRSQTYLSILNF
jgi:hypothetical protein